MKKTEITPTFVIICLAILIAAYGIGYCIHEIRFSNTKAAQNKILTQELQDIKSYVVNEEPQGQVSAQTRRTRPQTTNINSRTTFTSGRGQQRGRGMQNLSQQDLAAMQEQQRLMRQNFQNMADNQGAQMFGDFGATGDPAAMMSGGYDPAAMMGGFDPAAMGAPGMMGGFDPAAMGAPGMMGGFDPAAMGAPGMMVGVDPAAMGDPGAINPPDQQIEN